MAGQMPNYILREWNNDGKLLAGGLVYFYESGTYTPKAVYTDATYTIQHTNPVVLDAGGAADIFLGDGAYRVLVKTSTGIQVRSPIDGVVGVSSSGAFGGPGSNATGVAVALYADLRALTTAPDVVYVAGRTTEGDGGQGWFQKIPGSFTDDGGVMLLTTPGAVAYKRIFDGFLDPRWYGVVYGSAIDNASALTLALSGSIRWNMPVLLTGSVYLATNLQVNDGASLHANIDGFFNSGATAITVTFQTGAKLESQGVVFGPTINPVFQRGVALDSIKLSWFGGTADQDRWTKLATCSTYAYQALADVPTNINLDLYVPSNFALDFADGKVTISGTINLDIGQLAYTGNAQIFDYGSTSNIGTVHLGCVDIYPEWFGANGDGTTDDSIAVLAAAKTGRIKLTSSDAYVLGALWSTTPTPLSITGGHLDLAAGKTLGTGDLALEATLISNVSGSWFAGTSLNAVNSEFPATYTATTKSVVGCRVTGSALFPVFDGAPLVKNAHLDLISKQILATDALGKIVEATKDLDLANVLLHNLQFNSSMSSISGDVTLTHPLPLFITLSPPSNGITITLPDFSFVPSRNEPNIIFIMNGTSFTYNVRWHGILPTPWLSTSHNRSMFMYWDRSFFSWIVLKGA